jgi:predicted RNA methylase
MDTAINAIDHDCDMSNMAQKAITVHSRKRTNADEKSSSISINLKSQNTTKGGSQKSGRERSSDSKEQFYTKPDMAGKCVAAFAKLGYKFDLIVDPSAGSGVFLPFLRQQFPDTKIKAYDIDPVGARDAMSIKERDFLMETDNVDVSKPLYGNYKSIAVCTNPPFGSKSKVAKQFFKKASTFASVIALVLSASFAKQSMQSDIDRNWFLVHQIDFIDGTFEVNGKDKHFQTVFQVWEKREYLRISMPCIVPHLFEYVDHSVASTIAHIAIPRNGPNVAKAEPIASVKHFNGYWYYITSPIIATPFQQQAFCELFNQLDWPCSVYTIVHKHRSVGKGEINESIDDVLLELNKRQIQLQNQQEKQQQQQQQAM